MKLLATGAAILLFQATSVLADEDFAPLRQEAVKILQTRYPDAGFRTNAYGQEEFAIKTRSFMVYRLDKIGDWQKPHEEQGPDRSGIVVRFTVEKGAWAGALSVPSSGTTITTDLHIFRETLVVRNSTNKTSHVWAHILTPAVDPPSDIQQKLVALFHDFEKYK